LCRVQPPGAAPEPSNSGDSSVFPIPPQPVQRAADTERRFRARAASGLTLPSCSRDGFRDGITDYPDPLRVQNKMAGGCFGAAPGCVAAFPSPPNQVDRRVTRPRDTRLRYCAPAAVMSYKMPNKMLIDATHPEETRVVVVRGNRVEEFNFETAQRKQLRGNIY